MRYPSVFLTEIRDRITVSQVVGRRVQWDRKKSRPSKGDYWACCCLPGHTEKTASLHVDDRRQAWHCFGCQQSGDIFKFLMIFGRSFPEAVTELAQEAGIPMPAQTPEAKAAAVRHMTLADLNERAARYYQAQLQRSTEAMAYAAKRGLTAADIATFRIGYAPANGGVRAAADGQEQLFIDAGLLVRSEEDGRYYDRFTNRLIFPVLDANEKAIAFSGRTLTNHPAKYLNSPATELFDKSSVLYNYHAARAAALDGKTFVLVEGHLDVISQWRAGFAACGVMGTALTEEHVRLLQRVGEVTLCFDGDAAGKKAAYGALDLILPHVSPAFTVRFAMLPAGVDPDDLGAACAGYINAAGSVADLLWRREADGAMPSSPEQRAKLQTALRRATDAIADKDTRRAFAKDMGDRMAALGRRPNLYRSNSNSNHSTSPSAVRLINGLPQNAMSLGEAILVGAIATAPDKAAECIEGITSRRLSKAALDLIGRLTEIIVYCQTSASVQEAIGDTSLGRAVAEAMDRASAAGVRLSEEVAGEILSEPVNVH